MHKPYKQQQPTTNNQQPTTNNQQPTTNNQQPTTNNQQPTTNNQQPTTNNQQPTTNNQQPTTNNQQPTTNNQQPTTNNQQPTTNNQQPTTNNQQPTTNNQQPTTNNQQPTTNNQQPTTNNQQPTTNNQQPTTNNQQPTTNNLNTSFHSSVFLFARDHFSEDFMWAAEGAAHAGAAKRRRERRHRAYLKYARMSVAMALSECKHHTSRGQRMDRARRWERAALHGHVPEQDQIVDTAPALPILDVPVPLMGEQLVDVLRFFDTLCPVAEQVIDVPKIILEDMPSRRLCRDPQQAEQLVEVPNCPVLFSRKLTFQFLVVEGDMQIFKVFAQDRVQQRSRHPQFLALQLIGSTLRIRRFTGFLALFPAH